MKIRIEAHLIFEYEIDEETAIKAFGTADPLAIAGAEIENLNADGDYLISMMDGEALADEFYAVEVDDGTTVVNVS